MQTSIMKDLNKCVDLYKRTSGTKKDEAFQVICKHLTHHINSIFILLLDKNYTVNPIVFKMMKRGLQISMGSVLNEDTFRITLKMLASGFEEDDVRQQVYLSIIDLLRSYTHPKLTFLEFVTYLLPRRIFSWLQKHSKDASAQFSTEFYSGMAEDPEFDSQDDGGGYLRKDPFIDKENETMDLNFIFEDDTFLTEQEKDFMSDYLSANLSAEALCKRYCVYDKVTLHAKADAIIIKLAHAFKHKNREGGKGEQYTKGIVKRSRTDRCKTQVSSSHDRTRREVYADRGINRNLRRECFRGLWKESVFRENVYRKQVRKILSYM